MAPYYPNNKNLPVEVYDVSPSFLDPQNLPVYYRDSPLKVISNDAALVFKNASHIPNIFLPFPKPGVDISFAGILLQAITLVGSVVITVIVITCAVVGLPSPWSVLLGIVAWVAIVSAVQGKVLIEKPTVLIEDEAKFEDEKWFFVNGICTSRTGNSLVLKQLHGLFHRPVLGILNRTQGIWFDLIQCLIQRDLAWPTEDVRVGYLVLSEAVRNKNVKKVVLIAHSQGGIIASKWADQLLLDFDPSILQKVEIYTFAAAASFFSGPTFNNPKSATDPGANSSSTSTSSGSNTITGTGNGNGTSNGTANGVEGTSAGNQGAFTEGFVFGRIEHFANSKDFVSRIGVLAFSSQSESASPKLPLQNQSAVQSELKHNEITTTASPGTIKLANKPIPVRHARFAGRVFVRQGASGHLISSHYLKDGESILDCEVVRANSRLVKYLNGGSP